MAIKVLHDEPGLLAKIAEGDQFAFKMVYDHFHESVYTFSLWYLKSEQEAEETVQEVFLKLWKLGPAIKKITSLNNYLKTLTRNRSLDVIRRRALEIKFTADRTASWKESHNDTEEKILLRDTNKILQQGIDLLPPQQKLVYQLCVQQGLKNDEVAARLGLSPLTVRTHTKLALKFLRSYIGKHTDIAALLIIFKLF